MHNRLTLVLARLLTTWSLVASLASLSFGQVTSLTPLFDFELNLDVPYATGGGDQLLLDIFDPSGPEPHPAIVLMHPSHSRKHYMRPLAGLYASRGFWVASIDFRAPTQDVDIFTEDGASAVRFLRENADQFDIDPKRIGIGGFSGGARGALRVAYNELGPEAEVGAVMSLAGSLQGDESLIESDGPPMFLVHGAADTLRPFADSEELFDRANEVGVPAKFVRLDGGHNAAFNTVRDDTTVLQQTVEFFNQHLDVASLEAELGTRDEVLLPESEWSYFVGTQEPSPFPELAWTMPDFEDDSWAIGREGFGYGRRANQAGAATEINLRDEATSLYLRKEFVVENHDDVSSLVLGLDYDDAFIAYINGVEVARGNLDATGPSTFDGMAETSRLPQHATQYFIDAAAFPNLLSTGENSIAIQGLNRRISDRDFLLSNISLATYTASSIIALDCNGDGVVDVLDANCASAASLAETWMLRT